MPGETELADLSALMQHLESLKQENKTEHNRLVDRAKSAIGGLKNGILSKVVDGIKEAA